MRINTYRTALDYLKVMLTPKVHRKTVNVIAQGMGKQIPVTPAQRRKLREMIRRVRHLQTPKVQMELKKKRPAGSGGYIPGSMIKVGRVYRRVETVPGYKVVPDFYGTWYSKKK